MWENIKYVSTGTSLVAFIFAVVAYIYKLKGDNRIKLIKSAKNEKQVKLINNMLEFFNIETSKLTNKQRFDLAIQQVSIKSRKHLINAIVTCIISLSFLLLAGFAITKIPNEETTNYKKVQLDYEKLKTELKNTQKSRTIIIDNESDSDVQNLLSDFAVDFQNQNWKSVISYFSLEHVSAQFDLFLNDHSHFSTLSSIEKANFLNKVKKQYIIETMNLDNSRLTHDEILNNIKKIVFLEVKDVSEDVWKASFVLNLKDSTKILGSFLINKYDKTFFGPFG